MNYASGRILMRIPAMIACSLALLFLVSCTTCSAGSTEFPIGTFIHENHQQFVQENQPHRNWAFQFNEDGTWAFFHGDIEVPAVSGTYTVDGNLYTEASSDYEECPFPATYAWNFDGEKLTFALQGEDDCSHRRVSYDGQAYVKSE